GPWFLGEPPGKRGIASVARRHLRLRLASGHAFRAFDADMEMLVMTVDRAHLAEQRTIALPGLAKLLLDRGIDEDPVDLGVAGRLHDEPRMGGGPAARIDR